jgi:hypothetical protein
LPEDTRALVGRGVGIDDVRNPPIDWNGADTFIQIKGVDRDLGVFDDPDALYAQYGPNLSGLRRLLFGNATKHLMKIAGSPAFAAGARSVRRCT